MTRRSSTGTRNTGLRTSGPALGNPVGLFLEAVRATEDWGLSGKTVLLPRSAKSGLTIHRLLPREAHQCLPVLIRV